MSSFHFIRAEYLLLIIPLIALSWFLLRRKLFSRSWQSIIDPKLLPHLLIGEAAKSSRLPIFGFFIGALIAIFALAGPAWEKLPQAVFKEQSALVILLDLSRSMDSTDIKPSRLSRARHKVSDILALRTEGQTALIGYAADAFTVSPLTDDTATINSLVSSLDSGIMPAQGSRADIALNKAAELLKNAGIAKGDILLITDGVADKSLSAFKQLKALGHRVSILAIGTEQGAPISLSNGGFLKDAQGSIVIPKVNTAALRNLAQQSAGYFSKLSAGDADIKHLLSLLEVNRMQAESKETGLSADAWREEGPWLLLLLIPLAALSFRKGVLSFLPLLLITLPEPVHALSWDDLWLNDNQRAAQQFKDNKNSEAASLFNHTEWKASAHFKAEEYEQALEQYQNLQDPESHYNRGNTLAKMNRIEEAIEAYNQALQLTPDHADALYNKSQLEKQQQQQEKKDGEKQDGEKQDGDNQSDDESQQSDNQNNEDGDSSQQKQSDNSSQQDPGQSEENQPQNADEQQNSDEKKSAEQQASQQEEQDKAETDENSQPQEALSEADKQEELSKQATQQWLRRVPDDPGGLLRNKFKYLYQKQKQQGKESQNW